MKVLMRAETLLNFSRRSSSTQLDKKTSLSKIKPSMHGSLLAINSSTDKTGLGGIIWNNKGDVMAVAIHNILFNGEVELAEAEAIRFGIKMAIDTGLMPLLMESDSSNVVKVVEGNFLSDIRNPVLNSSEDSL